MKKVIVKFEWKESNQYGELKTHLLTVFVGVFIAHTVRLFPDERGWYDGVLSDKDELIFTPDLKKAKQLIEKRVLELLKTPTNDN